MHVTSHKRKSVGGSVDFMCNRAECGKTFQKKSALQNHIDLHDNNLQICYFCPWRAPPGNTDKISTHFDQHLDRPGFQCSSCGRLFFRKREMIDHFEAIHEKTVGRYKCTICKFSTHSRTFFHNHVRNVHK